MGIYDRSYMHNVSPQTRSGSTMLWTLILANVAVFLVFPAGTEWWYRLALSINLPDMPFRGYQLVSSMFLHANFSHIFFNMFGLWIFGGLIANRIGYWKFLGLYLVSGLVGNLLFLLFYWPSGYPHILMGASGAVYGVMAVTAMLEPNRRFVMIFMPFMPIKTTTLVITYTVIELVSQLSGSPDGVAHLAHLGGFAGGYVFAKIYLKNLIQWDLRSLFRRGPRTTSGNTYRPSRAVNITPDPERPVTQSELDYLLDKISRVGVNGLSETELTRLRQAREQMNRDRQGR